MYKPSLKHLSIGIAAIIMWACTPDSQTNFEEIEEQSTTDILTEVLLDVPSGFDFRTHGKITFNITDNEKDALYEIFTEYRLPDPTVADSLQVKHNEIMRDGIIYISKFLGMSKNGALNTQLEIPTYSKKVFIRRKGDEGFTEYLRDITGNNVFIAHSRAASNSNNTGKSNSWTNVSSPLSEDVFVNGNARVNGGLNSNGFDLIVTGNLRINGSANLASTTTIEANEIDMNGSVNMNGGTMYADIVDMSGSLNGPGYIYYCTSYSITGSVNQNQSDAIFQQQCGSDTDGDGVSDVDDAYPNDNSKAFNNYSPSETDYGVLLFEDLWPSFGDYDFNDVPFRYRVNTITNANNDVVELTILCDVKSTTSGYINGLGLELDGIEPNQIQSVTGPIYTQGYITNNANGTESGQDNAVIIITDNTDNLASQTLISVVFTSPVSSGNLGSTPYNPFIIVNSDRTREIHLPNKSLTSLGTTAEENGGMNSDPLGNFISAEGYPWALSFLEDIPIPKESVRITDAYNNFVNWATNGGQQSEDWYKDLPGNRNESNLNN